MKNKSAADRKKMKQEMDEEWIVGENYRVNRTTTNFGNWLQYQSVAVNSINLDLDLMRLKKQYIMVCSTNYWCNQKKCTTPAHTKELSVDEASSL